MTVNDPNSEANRLARLQAQGINNRATENLSAAVVPPVTQPAPTTPMVQAPVDTNIGLSTPLAPVEQPAPIVSAPPPVAQVSPVTAEVKTPEPVKTQVAGKMEAPIDYTQAKGREAEIQANLDSFKAKGMTPDEIMRASDYQNATPEKRALIDPYLKVQVPTASAMYNAIATKADIPDDQKTSLPFKIAQNRYTKASSYSTMTPSQLSNEMNNSRFIQGSQAYEDVKAMNPKLVQDTENLRIVNGSKQNVFTTINNPDGTSTKVNNLEKTFAEDYMDNFGEVIKNMYKIQTPEEIRAIIYTDDVKQAQDKATEIELTMNELEKQLDNVDDDVDAEMKGSGATGSRIALEKASRKEKLGKEYNSQLKNYTTYANKANNLITQNTTVYTTQQQQKQAQNAAMMPFLQDQYKTQQEKIKAEAALADPATQIGATMKEFADLGIIADKNTAWHVAEQKRLGMSLNDYTKKMIEDFKAKPEYQRIQAQEAGKGISYETIGDSVYRKNADGSLTKTDISANKTKDPVWQEWTDSNGVKQAGWITPGVNPTVSTGVKPTGNIVPVTAGNKTVRLDQSGATGFENAMNQLKTAGISIVVGEGARDQANTIQSMANRYGIAFNSNNPAETAQKLRSAGHQVADPGKSNHESGMAIDVYGSSKLDAVTPAQEKILNANGWYSAGIPGDAGHFEYRGGGTSTGGDVMGSLGIPLDFQSRLWNMIPAQLKNSEGEKKTVEENIKNLYKSGMNVEDAALFIAGFNTKDPKVKEEAKKIIAQARGIGEKLPDNFFGNVSDYVNRNDMKGAQEYTNRVVEDVLKGSLGSEFISTPSLNFAKSTLDRVNSFIEKNRDKIGPVSGRIADLEKQFSNDKDYQALKTLLGGSLADTRRAFGGTAVTNSELQALRDFIGMDTTMPVENLITALQENYGQLQSKYNTQRGFYGTQQSATPVDKWSAIGDILSKALSGKPQQ